MHDTEKIAVGIGGVGGSGTRVVARIISELGFYIGSDLNESLDNLWFTLLFKVSGISQLGHDQFNARYAAFSRAMSGTPESHPNPSTLLEPLLADGRPQHDCAWLTERAASLLSALEAPQQVQRWAWKEPNTHLVLDRLVRCAPQLKYIHVVRNGLDMAFSSNQNQLRFWGPEVLDLDCSLTPRNSLRYWVWAHKRVLELGAAMDQSFLMINFDRLCQDPETYVRLIADFLGVTVDDELCARVTAGIGCAPSNGRFRHEDMRQFDIQDIEFVKALGFDTSLLSA